MTGDERTDLLFEVNRCVGLADKYGANQNADYNQMSGKVKGIEYALGAMGYRICWVPDGSKPARAVDIVEDNVEQI